ncbi:MAG: PAS domain S-box protein [Syntrophobacteraceae bacterium]|nr:PAS domain S-box protein [Syntrophobacteraceae bacterium]
MQKVKDTAWVHKICAIFLAALWMVAVLPASWASADSRTIKVGVYENPPKVFSEKSGRPAGIFIDIIEQIAKAEGWKIAYVKGTWQQGLDRLARGRIDLMPDVAYTAQREALYSFNKVPVLSVWSQVYARKGSHIRTILDLKGKRVAVLAQSIQLQTLKTLAGGFDMHLTLIPVADYQTEFEMVADGRADAGVTNRFYGLMKARAYGLVGTPVIFDPAPFFFAAPRNAPRDVLDAIDRHLAGMKADPQSAYYASLRRWTSEKVRFDIPEWLKLTGLLMSFSLLASLGAVAVFSRRVRQRTGELDRINESLREEERRYRLLFEHNPVPMLIYQRETFKMLAVNEAFVHHYGYSREEALALVLMDLYPEEDKERIAKVASGLKGRAYVGEWRHRKADGTMITIVAQSDDITFWSTAARIAVLTDVTDRKRLESEQKLIEKALRKSELRHRILFETANDGILLISGERFIDCNARALTMFGRDRDRVVGAPLHRFSPLVQPDGQNSEQKAREKIAQALSEGPQFFEWEHTKADGGRFLAEVSLNRLELGEETLVQVVVRDVTERKLAEAELRESSERFEAIFDMLPLGVCISRPEDGALLHVNHSFGAVLGYVSEEMVGQTSPGLGLWCNYEERDQMIEALREKGQYCGEVMLRGKDGASIAVNLCSKLIPLDGFKRMLVVIEDISDRKRSELAIRELNAGLERRVAERTAQLAVARDRAEAADRLKSAFLATMSHELRTPLNSIIGFTGVILMGLAGPLSEEQRKQLEMVEKSSSHLLSLINDVLDISKIEAGQLEVGIKPFAVRTSIENVLGIARPLAEKKGLSLRAQISPEVDMLSSDSRRFEQVLLNLLNNAVKFTDRGGVRLDARLDHAPPGSSRPEIRIAIADTGIGIRPEDFDALFLPFRQIDTGLSRQHEGTGLGLAICRRIAELLGGTIEAESKWGEGSVFTFSLPA